MSAKEKKIKNVLNDNYVAIYIRVSSKEQVRDGFSIAAQKEKAKQYVKLKDWIIYDFYIDEGISAKNLEDRPEAMRMLQDIKDGKVKNVVVYKIDRLTRSTSDLNDLLLMFEEYNCDFNSITESIDTTNAVGRMFVRLTGLFAEFERENLAERVAFGYEQKAREGYSSRAYGIFGYDFTKGVKLPTVNEYEKEIVNDIFNYYLNGKSRNEIARIIKKRKIPTKLGGVWTGSHIKAILKNPYYIGKVRYHTEKDDGSAFIVDGKHEPIVDTELFERAQAIASKRRELPNKKYSSENVFFSDFAFCSKCGSKLYPRQYKDKNVKGSPLYVNYKCSESTRPINERDCEVKGMSHKKLESAFIDYINNFSIKTIDKIDMQVDYVDDTKRIKKLENEIKKLELKHESIRDMLIDEEIDIQEYKELRISLNEKIVIAQDGLNNLKQISGIDKKQDVKAVKKMITDLKKNWSALTKKEKHVFLHKFVDKIYAHSENEKVIITDVEFINI